jgi:hypothetical protein
MAAEERLMTNGEFKLGRLNGFDCACLVVAILCVVGFVLAKAGHAGVDQAISGTQKIDIDIFFVGLKTEDLDLFKVGEPSSLTIRNVPVTPPMTITKVKHTPKSVAFLAPDGKQAVMFPDPTNPIAHDFEVTVTDTADVTKDGYVVRGNKLKVGNQVELESFKYRVQGVVVDIKPSKSGADGPSALPH